MAYSDESENEDEGDEVGYQGSGYEVSSTVIPRMLITDHNNDTDTYTEEEAYDELIDDTRTEEQPLQGHRRSSLNQDDYENAQQ